MTAPTSSLVASDLVARLTAPKPDHPNFRGEDIEPDVTALTPDELGAIWRFVDRAHQEERAREEAPAGTTIPLMSDNAPAYYLALAILEEVSASRHWPRFTDEQMLDYLERTRRLGWQRALGALAWRGDRVSPLPARAVDELRRILGPIGPSMPGAGYTGYYHLVGQSQEDALLIARSLSPDGDSPEAAAVADAYRQACPEGRYTRLALEWQLGFSFAELRARCWPLDGGNDLKDARCRQLDEHILRDLAEQLEAIHSGGIAYQGYKAVAEADIGIVQRAVRRSLWRAEPWFPGVIHTVLTLSSFPPDRKSKSVPSQTVACQVAEAISLAPTPAGIESIKEAAGLTTNATVRRTMETRLQQAKTALGLRPDVVLAMAAAGEPDKKQIALLAKLLQSSYVTDLHFSLLEWRQKLLNSQGGADFARALIWRAEPEQDAPAFSFMAVEDATGMRASNAQGEPLTIPETARIRLWHPLHGTPDERHAWRACLRRLQVRQPLRQAYREHYTPLPDELTRPVGADASWARNRSERFSDLQLSVKPLIGLARGEGWKIAETGLERKIGNLLVCFELGDTIRAGMDGSVESVALSFWRDLGSRQRRVSMADVPPVLFSEACRAVDLLVSTCAYAYRGDDPRGPLTVAEAGIHLMSEPPPPRQGPEHPQLRRERRLHQLSAIPVADMLSTRRQVLEETFSDQVEAGRIVFDGRSAQVGDMQVNLNTAKVSRDGEQIEFKVPKAGAKGSKLAALPWVPHDEAMLEKLVATIASLL